MKANPSLNLRLLMVFDPRLLKSPFTYPESFLEASSFAAAATMQTCGHLSLKSLTNLAEALPSP